MTQTLAMLLAGGKGRRMDMLCQFRPKPALPFGGSFRIIDFSLSNCQYSQIDDIAVLVDYQRSYMKNYLRQWQISSARSANLCTLEPKEDTYEGTADAVYQNLDYVQQKQADRVLILAGDHVYKLDYRDMLAFHKQKEADVTVGVIAVSPEENYRFGTVALDEASRITAF